MIFHTNLRRDFLTYGLVFAIVLIGLACLGSPQQLTSRDRFEWEVLKVGTLIHEPRISHLWFFDTTDGIVVTAFTIERTNDGGKTWNEVPIPGHQIFRSLVSSHAKGLWIVGSDEKYKPLIMETVDKGISWQSVDLDKKSLNELNGKFSAFTDGCVDLSGNVWLIGEGDTFEAVVDETTGKSIGGQRRYGNSGLVRALIDGHNLKVSSIFPTEERLGSISCSDSGGVWAAGEKGIVFHYENGWVRQEISKGYLFHKVISSGADVWILGKRLQPGENYSLRGILLKSRNNGKTWEDRTPNSANVLNDLLLRDGNSWLVGGEGTIYHSTDNGESWIQSKSPTQNGLQEIFFLDSQNGWIVGDKATVLRLQRSE